MSHAVFISYASQDVAAARQIAEALRDAGIEVWLDQSELRGGDAWDARIRRQIQDCALFVAVISANTNARLEGYFRREWKLAVDRTDAMAAEKAFLLPVVVDDTVGTEAVVPDRFRERQWTRLPGGEATPEFCERVRRLLETGSGRPSARATAGASDATRSPRSGPWRWLAGALVVAVAVAAGWLWRRPSPVEAAAPRPAAVSAIPTVEQDPSIAVLPLLNLSEEKGNEYFADGISEELLDLLAKVPRLRVIARTSSFSFKGERADVATIARQLQVAAILEGSVRKSGNRVRITLQLIRAVDSTHLWSETYDRTLDDIFKVQNEVAATVVDRLKVTLLGAAPVAKTVDPRAYALFLQGREAARQGSSAGFEQAIASFRQALAIEPAYAAALAGLGDAYGNQVGLGLRRPEEGVPLAMDAIKRALEIDPDCAPAHVSMAAGALYYFRDLGLAARQLERALALAPSNYEALTLAAALAMRLGRLDLAISLGEYLVARDPLNVDGHDALATAYRAAGRLEEALRECRAALALQPQTIGGHASVGSLLLQKGDIPAALAEYAQEPDESRRLFGEALCHDVAGRRAQADVALGALTQRHGSTSAYAIAVLWARRGDNERAFEWLDKAVDTHDIGLGAIRFNRWLDGLHADPRWLPLLQRLGSDPDQLAAIRFDVKLPR